MVKICKESSSDFSFEFGGENEIDANVVIETITSVAESIQHITNKIEPDAYVKVKVSSFECGSFDINLKAIAECAKTLFNADNIQIASLIVDTFVGCIKIKEHLKGEKPKSVTTKDNQTVITNHKGEKLTKDKNVAKTYFRDAQIDKSITNVFNVMVVDGSRDSLTVKQGENNVIKIEKGDFVDMAKNIVTDDDMIEETITNIANVDLLLKKPDLLGKSKWGFVLDKNIEAAIADEEWLKKVNSGQVKLYAGVKIPVKLLIEADLDEQRNPIATRYTVLKVTGDIIEPVDHLDKKQIIIEDIEK